MVALNIIFVILITLEGFNCLFGNVTEDSRLIFRDFFNQTGSPDGVVFREVSINTVEPFNAIRATDVSGENGIVHLVGLSNRHVTLLLTSGGVGRGFSIMVDIYSNNDGSNSKYVSMILITISLIFGIVVNN